MCGLQTAIVLYTVHDNVLAGVGIGILECEYGPGAGVSITGGRGINYRGPGYHYPACLRYLSGRIWKA